MSQAKKEILGKLGVNTSIANQLPDTLGLHIDQVVQLWYLASPWQGASLKEVEQKLLNVLLRL